MGHIFPPPVYLMHVSLKLLCPAVQGIQIIISWLPLLFLWNLICYMSSSDFFYLDHLIFTWSGHHRLERFKNCCHN